MSHISQAKIKFVQSLKYKKYRQKHEAYVIEGLKACQTALQLELNVRFVVYQNDLPDFIPATANSYEAEQRIMKQISSFDTPPQVICVVSTSNERQFDLQASKGNVILFLDRIQDPGNLGTIIRTADWYGVKTIILNRGCVDLYNPKSIQAAMGCHVNLDYYHSELDQVKLQKPDHKLVGLDMHGHELNKNLAETDNIVLVVGNEGQGMSDSIKRLLDFTAKIPGHPDRIAESLNAGISLAISLDRLLG